MGDNKITEPADASNFLDEIRFPFESGVATDETVRKIRVLIAFYFSWLRPISLPTSFLLDRDGQVAVIYRAPVSVDTLLKDIAILDASGNQLSQWADPLSGRRINFRYGCENLMYLAKLWMKRRLQRRCRACSQISD